jgi:hypothetical protein
MTDPAVTIYERIVELLKAEPTLYDPASINRDRVWLKNMIVYNGAQPFPDKQNRGDGDFPELDVDEGGYADTATTKWPTFGGTAQNGTCYRQQITQVYVLTLTLRDYRITQASNLRFAISKAMGAGGPRLGLPSIVQSWGPLSAGPPAKSQVKEVADAEKITSRRVVKINVPVTFLFNATDLQS